MTVGRDRDHTLDRSVLDANRRVNLNVDAAPKRYISQPPFRNLQRSTDSAIKASASCPGAEPAECLQGSAFTRARARGIGG